MCSAQKSRHSKELKWRTPASGQAPLVSAEWVVPPTLAHSGPVVAQWPSLCPGQLPESSLVAGRLGTMAGHLSTRVLGGNLCLSGPSSKNSSASLCWLSLPYLLDIELHNFPFLVLLLNSFKAKQKSWGLGPPFHVSKFHSQCYLLYS